MYDATHGCCRASLSNAWGLDSTLKISKRRILPVSAHRAQGCDLVR
jgi:hypothetical protein